MVFARVVSLLLLFCENRNCRETEKKILRQKNKKEEKHFLKHKLFTILMRAIIKKGGERQNVNVCGGGGI